MYNEDNIFLYTVILTRTSFFGLHLPCTAFVSGIFAREITTLVGMLSYDTGIGKIMHIISTILAISISGCYYMVLSRISYYKIDIVYVIYIAIGLYLKPW